MKIIPIRRASSQLPKREKPDLEWAKEHIKGFRKYCEAVDEVKASEKEYQKLRKAIERGLV